MQAINKYCDDMNLLYENNSLQSLLLQPSTDDTESFEAFGGEGKTIRQKRKSNR
jgi:hypothetical protein